MLVVWVEIVGIVLIVLAYGVYLVLEKEFASFALQPLRRFNSICYDDDDDDDEEKTIPLYDIISQLSLSIVITTSPLVLPIEDPEDCLIMENEDLNTILEKESDEVINECVLPSCDDFSPINVFEEKSMTFSNPLFNSNDDFTSSDDESLSNEDVSEDNVKIYSNPLFEFDSDVNPLFNEVLEDIECKDSYDSNLDESTFLVTPLFDVNKDEYFDPRGDTDEIDAFLDIDTSIDINDGYYDSEGDVIYFENLLTNETIPSLPSEVFLDHDTKSLKDESVIGDSKNMVKIFVPEIHEKTFSNICELTLYGSPLSLLHICCPNSSSLFHLSGGVSFSSLLRE
nr:hypothetical protein [Tanacetum cinerariifolium]